MSQNENGAGSPIHRGAETTRFGHDGAGDSTQTFGHDSDLSFVPFAGELTATERDAIAALPSGSALLLVRSGPTAGARYLLDTDVTTAGRHPEADIFLDDVTVSRRHAEITRRRTSFEIVDQRSLNGTYVNGERVDRAELSNGAEVRIGKFRLNFFVSPADRQAAAPQNGSGQSGSGLGA
ncbi:FHA domain-containing protein [Microbacterium paludicola]|uniref:FHA domain-containing protein n=1 Tax=Microbacterium paludicola TaxID=300019 RepID=UPI00337562DE